MDLRDAIEKATQIPKTNEEVSFVRLTKPDQATIARNKNKRKLRPPRNIKLVEQDDPQSHHLNTDYTLNESEILSSIRAVNGGVSYSNKSYEDHWKSKQLDCNPSTSYDNATASSSKPSCSRVTETLDVEDTKSIKSKEKSETENDPDTIHEVLQKCNLSKNAVISGLLNSNQITLQDLKIPKQANLDNEKSQNQSDPHTRDIVMGECLVQHPNEPDIYIHPLQMTKRFEKKEGGAADFVVEHVGVKKTITPRQYYISETENMSFEFVKKNVKDK